jgi:hypothetical protein
MSRLKNNKLDMCICKKRGELLPPPHVGFGNIKNANIVKSIKNKCIF